MINSISDCTTGLNTGGFGKGERMSRRMPYRRPKWAVQQVVRGSGLVEDICKHGVGHPNSDWLNRHDPKDKRGLALHGCDGCCKKKW